MILALLIACSNNPSNSPTTAELEIEYSCTDYDHIPSCYELGKSEDYSSALLGLHSACYKDYKDSCRLLYEFREAHYDRTPLESSRRSEELDSFYAAVRSCTVSSDREMCSAALSFHEKHPDQAKNVERERPRLLAALRGEPIPPHPPSQPLPPAKVTPDFSE